ncbi:MAG: 4-alpha-glucanotransferase [Myxococcota bacterium]|nr:4-alpha-glucanotransferase [Myxococcota bacterium]
MPIRRPALRELAERAGIVSAYRPAGGGAPQRTSDATRERLLAAQGLPADTEAAAREGLARVEEEEAALRAAARRAAAEDAAAGEAPRAFSADDALGAGRRVFGLWANLYSLRSEGNLGVGDLGDLRRLVALAADRGAGFVGLSPLHAQRNRGHDVSPYAPISRLFRNALYLDVDAVPEASDPEVAALRARREVKDEVAALRAGDRIDPPRAAHLKARIATALHAAFLRRHGDGGTARARAYADYRAREGGTLDDFATFAALEEERPGATRSAALRDPRGEAARRFREENAAAVDRHRFVQFELDRQLGLAADAARAAGMPLGLYPDLALGSQGGGFDPWMFPALFVPGVSVGAPPDAYAAEGQDWGFPPLHPRRLGDDDFAFLRRLLQASLRHAGALRIDHVLGFFRQWWIPEGRPAREGAYVRFPARALLRVAAQESRRARALLIGEDLGTVPPQVPPSLARHEILSSRVLLFERERGGRFKPASRWSPRALATVNTHDLPTFRAWLEGRDLDLRRELGLLPDDDARAEAGREREAEREALRRRLVRDGHLPRGLLPEPSWPAWTRAAHAFLCATPARLAGLSLDDVAGEVEPVNVPGVGPETWPSWTRRMGVSLEALPEQPGFGEALAGAASRGAPPAGGRRTA